MGGRWKETGRVRTDQSRYEGKWFLRRIFLWKDTVKMAGNKGGRLQESRQDRPSARSPHAREKMHGHANDKDPGVRRIEQLMSFGNTAPSTASQANIKDKNNLRLWNAPESPDLAAAAKMDPHGKPASFSKERMAGMGEPRTTPPRSKMTAWSFGLPVDDVDMEWATSIVQASASCCSFLPRAMHQYKRN